MRLVVVVVVRSDDDDDNDVADDDAASRAQYVDNFYLRDAMPASVLAVSVSVCHESVFYREGQDTRLTALFPGLPG